MGPCGPLFSFQNLGAASFNITVGFPLRVAKQIAITAVHPPRIDMRALRPLIDNIWVQPKGGTQPQGTQPQDVPTAAQQHKNDIIVAKPRKIDITVAKPRKIDIITGMGSLNPQPGPVKTVAILLSIVLLLYKHGVGTPKHETGISRCPLSLLPIHPTFASHPFRNGGVFFGVLKPNHLELEQGKYQSLSEFCIKQGLDLLCMQETKSTSSDEIKAKGGKFLLSGSPDDKSAGVGFYIPPKTLPLMQDFIPFTGRLAALILRMQPYPLNVLSAYAPSMLQDPKEDLKRKQKFWDELPSYLNQLPNLPQPATRVIAGDLNARMVKEDHSDYAEYVGPVALPTDSPFDETTNYAFLIELMVMRDFVLASSNFNRPPTKMITCRVINSNPDAAPNSPSLEDFAIIDHVLVHEKSLHQIAAVSSQTRWQLPWFHRHYPVTLDVTFDSFAKPPPKPSLKTPVPRQLEDRALYRTCLGSKAPTAHLRSTSHPDALYIYTDGSCPDQFNIGPGNPVGRAFTFRKHFVWYEC